MKTCLGSVSMHFTKHEWGHVGGFFTDLVYTNCVTTSMGSNPIITYPNEDEVVVTWPAIEKEQIILPK